VRAYEPVEYLAIVYKSVGEQECVISGETESVRWQCFLAAPSRCTGLGAVPLFTSTAFSLAGVDKCSSVLQ